MSTPTDPALLFDAREQTAKLPRWASELITDLRRTAEQWKTYAEQVRSESGPGSPVLLDYYSATPIGLPVERNPIYFCDPDQLDFKGRQTALLSVRWDPGQRVLTADSLSGEPLMVVPVASNVVKLAAMTAETRRMIW